MYNLNVLMESAMYNNTEMIDSKICYIQAYTFLSIILNATIIASAKWGASVCLSTPHSDVPSLSQVLFTQSRRTIKVYRTLLV